jgi:hypothetical protein
VSEPRSPSRHLESVQLRLCPTGQPTTDVDCEFARVPCIGEYVDHGGLTYRVVDVHWFEDGPLIVAHSLDRPRAQAPFGGGVGDF